MNDATLNYDEAGTGPALLLIHGFPHDRRLWWAQIAGLQDVAHVIAPDLRGFGGSADPAGTMTMDDHADDLHQLLLGLGIRKAVIAGLSMGGYVALAFLSRHPNMVRGLVLCNTRAAADSAEAREGREETARKVMANGVPQLAEAMLPKMLSQATRSDRPALSSSILAMMAEQRTPGVIAALRGMALRPDRTAVLATIKVPTLIITSTDDTMIPPADSRAMAGAIDGSTLLELPAAAHLSNVDAPEAFNSALRTFLNDLP